MNQIQSNVCMICGKPHSSGDMVCLLCRVKMLPEQERNVLKARLLQWEARFLAGRAGTANVSQLIPASRRLASPAFGADVRASSAGLQLDASGLTESRERTR